MDCTSKGGLELSFVEHILFFKIVQKGSQNMYLITTLMYFTLVFPFYIYIKNTPLHMFYFVTCLERQRFT